VELNLARNIYTPLEFLLSRCIKTNIIWPLRYPFAGLLKFTGFKLMHRTKVLFFFEKVTVACWVIQYFCLLRYDELKLSYTFTQQCSNHLDLVLITWAFTGLHSSQTFFTEINHWWKEMLFFWTEFRIVWFRHRTRLLFACSRCIVVSQTFKTNVHCWSWKL